MEVTAGPAESNGSLLPGLWRDSLHATCGLTACTPGSAPGPTLGNEYGKTLPFSGRLTQGMSGVAVWIHRKIAGALVGYEPISDRVLVCLLYTSPSPRD